MDLTTGILLSILLVALFGIARIFGKKTKKKLGKKKKHSIPGMERLLRDGRYSEAGKLAMDHERFEEAIDYFMRAQQPTRAAVVASKIGDARRAAELYERAGLPDRAAKCYEQAGMPDKARELMPPPEAIEQEDAAPVIEQGADDWAAAAERQRQGQVNAESCLAAGDIRGAADAYKDAQLLEEAIHLYVNVLGMPGEAAPLVASFDNHERAAELYELAGDNEHAADSWIRVAKEATQPEAYVEHITNLSDQKALTFLEEVTEVRPLAQQTVELHYQLGVAYVRHGKNDLAVNVFVTIQQVVGDYRDVSAQVANLQVRVSSDLPMEAPVDAPAVDAPAAATPDPVFSQPPISVSFAPATPPTGVPEEANIVVEPVSLEHNHLQTDEIAVLTMEAAVVANEQARRVIALTTADIIVPAAPAVVQTHLVTSKRAEGLAKEPLPDTLFDEAVQAARSGPSLSSLLRFLGGDKAECDLQNIEVYYRLGLAYTAAGRWSEAASAFHKVEEASPGYRDADRRAGEIELWQSKLGSQLTSVGLSGTQIKPEKQRYMLEGELGRGGMAVVYRAKDQTLGREIALKFLSDEFASNESVKEMFEREARSVAKLNHPNIVTIYDFGELENRTYIAMEYVEGITVKDMITERKQLSVIESLRIVTQLLDALALAHEQSIIHRDIKPSNIMQTATGLTKLMDFGLAKSVATSTEASIVAGTPSYMSPEQMLGSNVDWRTDLFAVGVTLYEMLTGVLPYAGMDRNTTPIDLRQHRATIPRMLNELVMRSIDFDPDVRFQTAPSFASPLRRILDAVGEASSTGDIKTGDLPDLGVIPQISPQIERLQIEHPPPREPVPTKTGTEPTFVARKPSSSSD